MKQAANFHGNIAKQQPSFDQVRYLDERGQEIIRANQGGVLVAPEKLQNKSDRPYFRDATSLAPGKILVSPFDLNIENGRIEVLRQIKSDAKLRMIPIVVMTSSREDQDIVDSYQLGVNAYVVKPLNFHEFLEAIKMLGSFWLVLNEALPLR